jgi:hypothetical protein
MFDPDAEALISHLSCGLAPDDRDAFRHAAETALASSPRCWGPASIHRTLVPLWRDYFRPPPDDHDRANLCDQERKRSSKLIDTPPLKGGRRRSRGIRIVAR